MNFVSNLLKLACFGLILSSLSCDSASKDISPEKAAYFSMSDGGELIRPTNYRTWVYVGTPVTPNDMNGGKAPFPEMHNVYIDPLSYQIYKKSGKFRDGTILIKELTSVGSKSAVSGKGYFMGEFIGLEASVKSSEHFPDEPGNWAIFSFTNPTEGTLKETAAAMPTAACNACHQANAEDDFVFTQYYPVLRAAKGVGEDVYPENAARREAAEPKEDKKMGIWESTAPTPEGLDLEIPFEESELFSYLQSEKYKSFKSQESEFHKSLGPHENVRAYINDVLAASLEKGNSEHPIGSVAVKEQRKDDGSSLGWAVMAKTQDETADGDGWFWYEVLDDKDISKKAAIGNGVPGCVSCHASGNDMVKISFPLH